jgi:predicted RNA-binding Zn-ribbon protein involved in translation (DUF1610 family)
VAPAVGGSAIGRLHTTAPARPSTGRLLRRLIVTRSDTAGSPLSVQQQRCRSCPNCGSNDTAKVTSGVIGRTIHLAAATTRVKLVPNQQAARFYCNACERFFDRSAWTKSEGQT